MTVMGAAHAAHIHRGVLWVCVEVVGGPTCVVAGGRWKLWDGPVSGHMKGLTGVETRWRYTVRDQESGFGLLDDSHGRPTHCSH